MSFEEAACVCESYITAFLNVFMIGGLKDGNTAILHGGGGGVNTAAIQLCKALVAEDEAHRHREPREGRAGEAARGRPRHRLHDDPRLLGGS